MSSRALVLDHIRAERKRQIAKHGDHWRDAGTWALIRNEETGEVARADLERNLLVELDHQALYEELVQTAAVAVAWAEQVRGDMLASGWPPRGPDQKHWTGMKDSCQLTRRIECLTTWAVLVGRVCDGPACQSKATVFRLDGDVIVDGQYYDKRV